MIHRDVAVYKVSPEKWISAGGLNRLEQHNRECTRIGRELARMSSLYNAQNAPVIEGDDSFPSAARRRRVFSGGSNLVQSSLAGYSRRASTRAPVIRGDGWLDEESIANLTRSVANLRE